MNRKQQVAALVAQGKTTKQIASELGITTSGVRYHRSGSNRRTNFTNGISLSSINGIPIYDSNAPGQAVPPMLINSYSTLTIPGYWRAVTFLANNLFSFTRSVQKDGVDVTHPITSLLQRRPNGYQDAGMWRTLFLHAVHLGNGYARIERDVAGRPKALHNFLPEDITPFRYTDDKGQIFQCYYHKPTKQIHLAADVIHFMGSLCYDGQAALAPITLFVQTFQKASVLDRWVLRYLMKGTVIRGSIEIPAGNSDELNEQIVNTIRTFFIGADAERDLIVLSGGAKLNNATLSPQDSQLAEQFNITTKQIAQITGVHPYFQFDDKDGKYRNTVEQVGMDVVRFTFRPMIELFEAQLSSKLLSDSEIDNGFCIHIEPGALVRGDTLTLTTTTVAKKAAGIISANLARKELGYPPSDDPDADKLMTTGDTTAGKDLPPPPLTDKQEESEAKQ